MIGELIARLACIFTAHAWSDRYEWQQDVPSHTTYYKHDRTCHKCGAEETHCQYGRRDPELRLVVNLPMQPYLGEHTSIHDHLGRPRRHDS